MTAPGAALLLLGAVYAAVIGTFAVGFRRVVRWSPWSVVRGPWSVVDPATPSTLPFVSVIVPARDEAAVIARCLDTVLACDYPAERFEVIVVDDLSEDDTPAVVERLMQRVNAPVPAGSDVPEAPERLRLLHMPENLERTRAHKKRAIEKGIAHARGPLILTTDADCTVPAGWLRAMAAGFPDLDADPEAGPVTAFVSGPVRYRTGGGLFARLQALEFLGLVAVGAGAIGAGRPTICNGANVAYRKDVFEALGGFSGIDHLTSGDDELLMQRIHDHTPHRVRFCAAPEAVVDTDPAPSPRAFFQQRRRWASKGAHYPNKRLVALFVAIYLFYAGLLAGALALPFAPALAPWLGAAFALKVLPEAALLWPACRHFGRRRLFGLFLPEQVLHVPYIVVLAAAGALGHYEWKGRRVAR
ncbi:MAG TPA: glycosyltransferase [Rubricoccaceae bacterium]|nr:glycosyltransferase [Rubricoccaceae bacterium]